LPDDRGRISVSGARDAADPERQVDAIDLVGMVSSTASRAIRAS
jgi:hypothetical protein